MSMTVHIKLKGMTDLELLQSAVAALGGKMRQEPSGVAVQGRPVVATILIDGDRLGIARLSNGELALVGDEDWRTMRDRDLKPRLCQQYAVAAVRRKAEALGYQVAGVEQMENGSLRVVARAWR